MPQLPTDCGTQLVAPRPVPEPLGSILTTCEPGRAVVRLFGPIDIAVDEDLRTIAAHVVALAPLIVVDSSRMTFCDGTLATFLATTSKRVPVTLNRPARVLCELILLWGLAERVQVADRPDLPDGSPRESPSVTAEENAALRQEVEQLKAGLVARREIGQAQGMLMLRYGVCADRAHEYLRRRSQDQNFKLREVAVIVIAELMAQPPSVNP